MISRSFKVLVLGLVLGLAGCSVTEGSGVRSEESRKISPFEEIEASGEVTTRIIVDENAPEGGDLKITGDDNLVPKVSTRTEGNKLVVDLGDHDVDPKLKLEVTVRTRRLGKIHAQRSAEVDITTNARALLDIRAETSAKVIGHGTIDRIDAELSSSAKLWAKDLRARDVKLEAGGSSKAEVCVTGHLEVDLGGSSEADYYCSPSSVDREIGRGSELEKE